MIVSGTVQGVGFRYYVQDIAKEMGITGWVRNLPDGTVEIDAEGKPDILDVFIRKISSAQQGFIQVHSVQVQEKDYYGYSHFTIRRD
ncbi:MAG TPA: acylphosphatase [Methanospirillum sp.]|nr:acylphosphatase [Methanospirillum sp.]